MTLKLVLILALLVIATLYVLRIIRLYGNSSRLITTSSTFNRDYYLGESNNRPVSFVALGDSVIEGAGVTKIEDTLVYRVADSLVENGYYVHVQNFGQSGAKLQDLMNEQLPKLSSLKPDYIMITVGANDATHFTGLQQYKEDMNKLIDELQQKDPATVLLANSIDVSTAPALPPIYSNLAGQRAKKQNIILDEILKAKNSKVKVIDLYEAGKLKLSDNPAFYANDLFHPAVAGYVKWGDLFIQKLK